MLNLEWSLIIWGKYRTNGRFFLVAVFSWHFTYVVVVLMESVFMHFDANYVSIMCEWAIVNYRTGILGTSVTKQKGKDLAVVHTWSLTIGPLLYLVPGTIPYHVPTGSIQHFDPNYGLVVPPKYIRYRSNFDTITVLSISSFSIFSLCCSFVDTSLEYMKAIHRIIE